MISDYSTDTEGHSKNYYWNDSQFVINYFNGKICIPKEIITVEISESFRLSLETWNLIIVTG